MKNLILLSILLSIPVSVSAHHTITENEKACQALNIYHEARSEPILGQYLILDVVKNRSDSPLWPHNLCDVIYQPMQFTWANDGWKKASNKKRLGEIRDTVNRFYNGLNVGISSGSTHYHATYVAPKWSKKLTRVLRVDNHIFYKI